MSIAGFLQLMVGPLARRGAAALGFGLVTFVGLDLAVAGLISQAREAYNGLPADLLGYLGHAGVGHAASIVCGAITARVVLAATKSMTLL